MTNAPLRASSESVPERAAQPVRRVSIIVPMLNEAEHVGHLVADIAEQDYDGELEILVADGGSADDSVARLRKAVAEAGLETTVIPNPGRWVAPGLNACIRRASGDLIIRLDCHTRYPSDYLRRSVEASVETGAWLVGGLLVPEGRTTMERAIACATDSPFGGVHWTRHAGSTERVGTDTVYCGVYQPEAFARAGLFDESLVRNQDDELALRIRKSGGRVVLDPSIRQFYTPRGSFRSVFQQYYEYGLWKIPVMRMHQRIVSARSLAPAGFVGSVLLLTVLATRFPGARALLAAELGLYGAAAGIFAVASIRAHCEQLRLLPLVIAVYPALHTGFGLGFLRSAIGSLHRC